MSASVIVKPPLTYVSWSDSTTWLRLLCDRQSKVSGGAGLLFETRCRASSYGAYAVRVQPTVDG